MKRVVFFTAGLAVWLFAGAVPAMANNGPHRATGDPITDSCAGCHRVHTAKAPRLLKEAQSSLCFTCHGAGGTGASNDVVDGVGYSTSDRSGTPGALRGGGFSYALIGAGTPDIAGKSVPVGASEEVTSTHSVNSSDQTAWGFGTLGDASLGKTIALSCGNCHDPHGNGNYRILRTTPRGLYAKGETTLPGAEVAIPDVDAGKAYEYTTTNYWKTDDANALGFATNIAAWCSTCHSRYPVDHGGSTYSGDPVYSYRHTSNQAEQGTGKRTCIQCHVAHGSNSSTTTKTDSVPFPGGTPAVAGDSRLLRVDNRGVCQMCHNK
jgi:predicted CXXCH cytochrome family protein